MCVWCVCVCVCARARARSLSDVLATYSMIKAHCCQAYEYNYTRRHTV